MVNISLLETQNLHCQAWNWRTFVALQASVSFLPFVFSKVVAEATRQTQKLMSFLFLLSN